MSYRTDYDSWPWRGHERQAEDDAQRGRKNRDLYDHHDGDHKRTYADAYDREERRLEERRAEERREEERAAQRHEAEVERQRMENYWERERQQEEAEQDESQDESMTPETTETKEG